MVEIIKSLRVFVFVFGLLTFAYGQERTLNAVSDQKQTSISWDGSRGSGSLPLPMDSPLFARTAVNLDPEQVLSDRPDESVCVKYVHSREEYICQSCFEDTENLVRIMHQPPSLKSISRRYSVGIKPGIRFQYGYKPAYLQFSQNWEAF